VPSGLQHNFSPGRDAEGSAASAKWRSAPNDRNGTAWEPSTGAWHLQVELPSRRWYIEAAGETSAAE